MDEDQQRPDASPTDIRDGEIGETPARMSDAVDEQGASDDGAEGSRFVADSGEASPEPEGVAEEQTVEESGDADEQVETEATPTEMLDLDEPDREVITEQVIDDAEAPVEDLVIEAEPAPNPVPPQDAVDTESDAANYSPFRTPPQPAVQTPEEPGDATSEMSQADLLAAERAERKAARDKALGTVARVPEPEPAAPVTVRTTDKFFPSLGLFLLRLVVALIFGIRAVQHFTNLQATTDLIATTWIPEPGIMALVLCGGEILIAAGLLLGVLTRVAGFGVAAVAGGALVFVLWGASNPFVEGQFGFVGEYELVLVAVGLLYILVGGGAWSVDGSFRRARQRRKETGD